MQPLFTLVRRLARREVPGDVRPPNWLVRLHRLGPLMGRAGSREFREDLARGVVEWKRLEIEITKAVGALTEAGIAVVPLKGASYAKLLYDTPAERPMGDVDVLVPPRQVARVRQLLTALGFARGPAANMHHAEPWHRPTIAIDLHWNIISPGRSRIDLEELWGRTTNSDWLPGAKHLDPDDALLFHLVHLTRNRLVLPLVHVIDAARLFERGDLDVVVERARRWGLERSVTTALRFCKSMLDEHADIATPWWPTPTEIVSLTSPGPLRKVAFDVIVAGSAAQLFARVRHFAANRVRPTDQ